MQHSRVWWYVCQGFEAEGNVPKLGAREPHRVTPCNRPHWRDLQGRGIQRLPLSEGRRGKRAGREGTGFL